MSGCTKKAVICGVSGYGHTIREAKEDALERIGEILERFEEDATPRIVSWRGYAGIVYREMHGVCSALIAQPESGMVRVSGPLKTCGISSAQVTLDDAERDMRLNLAQLAWKKEDGSEPPEILRATHSQGEFRAWAKWQSAYQEAVAGGVSDENARCAATDACW